MNGDFTIDEPSLRDAPAFTLHPVHGVVWGAFFGSPVAAGIILALNYSRMGKSPPLESLWPLLLSQLQRYLL